MFGKSDSTLFDDGLRLRLAQERGELLFTDSPGKRAVRRRQPGMGQHFRQKNHLKRFRLFHQ